MSKFYTILEKINKEEISPYTSEEVYQVDDVELFINALKTAQDKRTEDSLQLYMPSEHEIRDIVNGGGSLFMTNDGLAGAYVKYDGYMGGLFKDPSSKRSQASKVLQKARIEAGGRFFDAFATYLEPLYVKNGFRPLYRMDFDVDQAPTGWEDTNLRDKPDNVFFVYDPYGDYKVGDGEILNDFEKAYELSKNYQKDVDSSII